MQLTVRDVSTLLSVSEKTIYRWVKQGVLPAYRVNEQYRFNRAELLEWATSRRMNVSAALFEEPESNATPIPGLLEALRVGGILYRPAGRRCRRPAGLRAGRGSASRCSRVPRRGPPRRSSAATSPTREVPRG